MDAEINRLTNELQEAQKLLQDTAFDRMAYKALYETETQTTAACKQQILQLNEELKDVWQQLGKVLADFDEAKEQLAAKENQLQKLLNSRK